MVTSYANSFLEDRNIIEMPCNRLPFIAWRRLAVTSWLYILGDYIMRQTIMHFIIAYTTINNNCIFLDIRATYTSYILKFFMRYLEMLTISFQAALFIVSLKQLFTQWYPPRKPPRNTRVNTIHARTGYYVLIILSCHRPVHRMLFRSINSYKTLYF